LPTVTRQTGSQPKRICGPPASVVTLREIEMRPGQKGRDLFR
jgi:hypothetical protein